MLIKTLIPLALLMILVALPSQGEEPLTSLDTFREARSAYDEEEMATLRSTLGAAAEAQQTDFTAQWNAAEALRISASELRTRRQAHGISGKEAKDMRQQQAVWAIDGQVFANRALLLAKSTSEKAASHRVLGELYANSITGMMSGMRNGPKAKEHVKAALAATPEDLECQRAIGIMYLNNPPITGGDIEKAITTFSHCHELAPDNDVYLVLLAMAYRKDKQWDQALDAAQQAMAVNSSNSNATALKRAMEIKVEAAK